MDIKIVNSIPNAKATITKSTDGGYIISITEDEKRVLGNMNPGSVVKLGNREYIVLEHSEDTTAIIAKEFAKKMQFGDNGDYANSNIRKYCNGEFYSELVDAVGEENIIEHTVNLVADDGTGKDKMCKDKVSILTTDLYRRYSEYLPEYGDLWWTVTRVSHNDSRGYSRHVCCVDSFGVLRWNDCGSCRGVRPFCILKSSILVS